MSFINRIVRYSLAVLTLTFALTQVAHAHLMAAQHGTLNIVDDGAFLVLSLPISAFGDMDADDDGLVSMIEFNNHRAGILESVSTKVTLSDANGLRLLEGVMLSPELEHDSSMESITQLTILGRFALDGSIGSLRFESGLYGESVDERSLKMTATSKADNRENEFVLTPIESAARVFSD